MSNYLAWLLATSLVGAVLAVAMWRSYIRRAGSRHPRANRLVIATLAVLFVGCAYATNLEQAGDSNCQVTQGDYTYGEFGWSTIPPGPTCTFTQAEHGVDEVRGPSPVTSVWLALVAAGAVAIVTVRRSEQPAAHRTTTV